VTNTALNASAMIRAGVKMRVLGAATGSWIAPDLDIATSLDRRGDNSREGGAPRSPNIRAWPATPLEDRDQGPGR
jgi:hypothetical protein